MKQLAVLLRRNADYRRLFSSAVVSFLGDWFALVAVSGLVSELTGRDGSTALVFAAQVLPGFLFAPLAGILADRIDRKRLLVAADLSRVIPALGLILALRSSQAWLAYLCVASVSALAAFFQPVVAAVVPNVVDHEDLSLAQTAIGSVWGTMLFIGAAVGGIAAGVLGREASFAINAATFLISAVLVWGIRAPLSRVAMTAGPTVLAHIGEVWNFVRPRKVTRAFLITKAGAGVGNGVVGLLPIYAITVFGAGDTGIGFLLAARGLGALVGPYLGRAIYRDEGRRLLWVCGCSMLVYSLGYAALPLAPGLVIAFLFITMAHIGSGNQWTASTTGLQMTTPDGVRGRVMSLDYSLATLSTGVSALLAGALAELVGLRATTQLMAGLPFVYGISWLVWTRDLWRADDDPVAAARSRDLPDSGPAAAS